MYKKRMSNEASPDTNELPTETCVLERSQQAKHSNCTAGGKVVTTMLSGSKVCSGPPVLLIKNEKTHLLDVLKTSVGCAFGLAELYNECSKHSNNHRLTFDFFVLFVQANHPKDSAEYTTHPNESIGELVEAKGGIEGDVGSYISCNLFLVPPLISLHSTPPLLSLSSFSCTRQLSRPKQEPLCRLYFLPCFHLSKR